MNAEDNRVVNSWGMGERKLKPSRHVPASSDRAHSVGRGCAWQRSCGVSSDVARHNENCLRPNQESTRRRVSAPTSSGPVTAPRLCFSISPSIGFHHEQLCREKRSLITVWLFYVPSALFLQQWKDGRGPESVSILFFKKCICSIRAGVTAEKGAGMIRARKYIMT